MLNVTTAFRQALANDERNYLEYVDITLADNTVLHLTNANIWQNGFSVEDSVGSDNEFSALGATIINSCTIVINNIYDDYSDYDFTNAKVVLQVGMELPDGTSTFIDKVKKGTFTVDEATYNGALITLKCLDYMEQFDRPYSESALVYPKTLREIVLDACSKCGVSLANSSQQFPHYDYSIPTRPTSESITFREVIGWCATIAGCFARFNVDGQLEIKWFNQDIFEQRKSGTDGGEFDTNSTSRYTTGDAVNGGTFNPWNTGDVADGGNFTDERPFHHISSLYNQNISVDDVVITGVRITVKADADEGTASSSETKTYLQGQEGYVIEIKDNEFLTETNANEVKAWLGAQLIGLTFRKADITHPSDPSVEAGDIAFVYDRKGVEYPILVTRTVFNGFGMQTTVSGASTPNRNSATRYTQATKSFVATRKELKQQKSNFDLAMEDLQEKIDNANGLHVTEVPQSGGGTITYLHNRPNPLAEQGVFEFPSQSDIVIMVSTAGVMVTNEGNTGGTTPSARNWYGLEVDGTFIAAIMNTIGLNFDWGTGGTLTLGGQNNINGLLRMLDADGNQIGQWDKEGLSAMNSFVVTAILGYTSSRIFQQNQKLQLKFDFPENYRGSVYIPGDYSDSAYDDGFYNRRYLGLYGKDLSVGSLEAMRQTPDIKNVPLILFKGNGDGGTIMQFLFHDDRGASSSGIGSALTTAIREDKIGSPATTETRYTKADVYLIQNEYKISVADDTDAANNYAYGYTPYYADLSITPEQLYYSSNDKKNHDGTGGLIFLVTYDSLRAYTGYHSECVHFSLDSDSQSIVRANKIRFQGSSSYYLNVATSGKVTTNGGALAFDSSSSKRYKHDITSNLDADLDPHKLYELEVVQFVYNEGHALQYQDMKDKTIVGFIAEDVDEIYPNATIHDADGNIESWDERRLLPPMLKLIQEQKEQIDAQQKEIDDLKARLERLEKLVDKLV